MQLLFISGRFPGWNELLDARGVSNGPWNQYQQLKKVHAERVAICARRDLFLVPEQGGFFTYLFVEPNRKRDPSNVAAGAVKIIEDALQKLGVLPGDGWKHVHGISSHCVTLEGHEGVLLAFDERQTFSSAEMVELYERQHK